MADLDTTRVDKWLWAVRLFKTRSLATTACQGGHVAVNGNPAKPATMVKVGDRVEARAGGRERILEVVRVIDKRVGAAVAAECVVDTSPPPPDHLREPPIAVRDRGSGRPSGKERRSLDRVRGRWD